jgi:hypothetical protein
MRPPLLARGIPALAAALATTLGSSPALADPAPRSAIVVQLPGASGAEIARRYAAGELDGGGFRPFFEAGEVGPGLLPVDPALPRASSSVLSTGRRAGELGVALEPTGAGISVLLDDGAAERPGPAAGTGTLWSGAESGRARIGAVLWPGAENRDVGTRATWGLPDREIERYPERSLVMTREHWQETQYGVGPGPALYWGLPKTVKSYTNPRSTSVPFIAPHERPDRGLLYELVAIDRTDDGRINFDGVLVSSKTDPQDGYVGIAEPGEWFRLELVTVTGLPAKSTQTAWIKVIDLAPDLSSTRIYVSATEAVRPYPAALVRRLDQQKITWPGRPSAATLEAGLETGFGVDLTTFVESAARLAGYAVDVAVAGRALFPTELTLIAIPVLDQADRGLLLVDPRQSGYSQAAAAARAAARRELFRALDRELARLLATVDLETTTVFLVSGYANAPVHSEVDLREALRRASPAGTDLGRWSLAAAGGYGEVRMGSGAIDVGKLRVALGALRDGEAPIFARIATRAEAQKLGLAGAVDDVDLRVWTRPGYRLRTATKDVAVVARRPGPHAAAGWAADDPAAQGLWLAVGAGIEKQKLRRPPTALDAAARFARAAGLRAPARGR